MMISSKHSTRHRAFLTHHTQSVIPSNPLLCYCDCRSCLLSTGKTCRVFCCTATTAPERSLQAPVLIGYATAQWRHPKDAGSGTAAPRRSPSALLAVLPDDPTPGPPVHHRGTAQPQAAEPVCCKRVPRMPPQIWTVSCVNVIWSGQERHAGCPRLHTPSCLSAQCIPTHCTEVVHRPCPTIWSTELQYTLWNQRYT